MRLQLRQLDDDILQAERDTFDFRRTFVKTPGSGAPGASRRPGHAAAVSAEKLMSVLDSQTKAKVAAVEKLFFKNTVAKASVLCVLACATTPPGRHVTESRDLNGLTPRESVLHGQHA